MEIEEAIVTRLTAQVPSLSGKIYPSNDVPPQTAAPYVAYQRISTARSPTLIETGSSETAFQFDIIGTSYSNMRTLRKSVRLAFEDALGEYAAGAPYVQAVGVLNEMDGFDGSTEYHTGILELSLYY